jgi:hypothetical protein
LQNKAKTMGILKPKIPEVAEKILKGMQIAYRKLVEETAARNGHLIVSEDGKPKQVQAKDLLDKVPKVD